MGKYIELQEYTKKKYLINAVVAGLTSCVGVYFADFVWSHIGVLLPLLVLDKLEAGPSMFALILIFLAIGYMLGYIHERIPHCTSPFLVSCVRFTGMTYVFSLPITYLLYNPDTLLEHLYWLDITGALIAVPAVVTVFLMYRIKDTKPTANVCPS